MSFTIKQPKKKRIKSRLQLLFTYSVYLLNNSSDNLVKNLGQNDFYHLSQEFHANVLDLIHKKGFLAMIFGLALKS